MTKSELRKLAIKELNTKKVQSIKKLVCKQFTDKKEQKDCMTAFDKSFIQSFISSRENKM